MIIPIKIPRGAAKILCGEREKSEKGYNIRKLLPALELYLILKSQSHKIHHFQKQLPMLLKIYKKSENTFRTHLKTCEEQKLITRSGNDLILTGWKNLSDLLLIDLRLGYDTINYDTSHKTPALRHLIIQQEFKENEERQLYAINKRLTAHPENQEAFVRFCEMFGYESNFTFDNYEQVKRLAFSQGTESGDYDLLHQLNLSTSRNVYTIAEAHGYSHAQGASYTKRILAEMGLIEVVKLTPAECKYKGTPEKHCKKGASNWGRFYNNKDKVAFLFQPDKIKVKTPVFTGSNSISQTENSPVKKSLHQKL